MEFHLDSQWPEDIKLWKLCLIQKLHLSSWIMLF